uniref:VP1 protein n=1 Tax=Chaerephon bat polyomavirus TaxID=3141916 RepID=A0AAU7E1V2_9POLY
MFGDNNSTTVLLTDENGWGIMCPNQEVFLTSIDFATQQQGSGDFKVFQYPRYFILYFRQRYVKSPVVLADIFQDYALKQVAGYTGETQNIMEVDLETGRREEGPTGMLNSTGVRNAPMNVTGGSGGGAALFSLPKMVLTDKERPPVIQRTPNQAQPRPDIDKYFDYDKWEKVKKYFRNKPEAPPSEGPKEGDEADKDGHEPDVPQK